MIRCVPIDDGDAARVAAFLAEQMPGERTPAEWARAIVPEWGSERPNAGYMLLDEDDAVVGAYLALYSEREIDGRTERICNLGTWCVLPAHRFHSLRLLRALLEQEGYHFTDLTPRPEVARLNARFGFRQLETEVAAVPALPWPSWPGRVVVSSDHDVIEQTLDGDELARYRDHRHAPAVDSVVLASGGDRCLVVFRKERRRGLRVFANVLYVSNARLLRRLARHFSRHLLVRHRAVAYVAEERVVGFRPPLAIAFTSATRRMYRSPSLEPSQIDYLYSELACLRS